MQCTVLLFAQLAESIGEKQLTLDLPEKAGVGEALEILGGQHPAIAKLSPSLAVAVNEQYATRNTTLNDGDTIAWIPPVSGG